MKSLFSKIKQPEEELLEEEKLRKEKIDAQVNNLSPKQRLVFDEILTTNLYEETWCKRNNVGYLHLSPIEIIRANEQTFQECFPNYSPKIA